MSGPAQPSVLIVEDDRKTAASIRLYLQHAGFGADVVHDGNAALAYLEARRPLALIVDVMLPGVNGLQICRQVREAGETPVLIVSARTEEPDRIEGLQLGADDYLTKPFSPRELVARLRAVLRRSGVRLRAAVSNWTSGDMKQRSTERRFRSRGPSFVFCKH